MSHFTTDTSHGDGVSGSTGRYVLGLPVYRDLGWPGVLPVDVPGVGMPPTGYTGGTSRPNWNVYPDDLKYQEWLANGKSSANLGLRVPDDVLVIDLDCYDGKGGCQTLEFYELQLGNELPTSWYSTSRQDGSRKIFFRVPRYDARTWKEPGNGMELLHHGHRWVRVWPSLNPKTSGPERWYEPNGKLSETPPRPDQLTELPLHWIEALSQWGKRTPTPPGGATGLDLGARETDGEKFDWAKWYGANVITSRDCAEARYSGQDGLLASAAMSLRATGTRDVHALMALYTLAGKFENESGNKKGDWTHEQVNDKWRRVVENHPEGEAAELPAAFRKFVENVTADHAEDSDDLGLTPARLAALRRVEADRFARRQLDLFESEQARGPRVKRTLLEYVELPQPEAVLPELLAAEVNLLAGPSEAGKSLAARDWAFDVARSGRNVLWVASEGMHDVRQRFMSRPDFHDVAGRINILDEPVNLLVGDDRWLLEEYADERPALAVFDLIYAMGMTDDNGVKDVMPVIAALKRISAAWGAATLAVGHAGHDPDQRRMRGSSVWRQQAAVEWHMAANRLTCEKSKIADKSRLERRYRIEYPEVIWTGTGPMQIQEAATRTFAEAMERREAIMRIVRIHAAQGGISKTMICVELGGNKEAARAAIQDLLLEEPAPIRVTGSGPGTRVVPA